MKHILSAGKYDTATVPAECTRIDLHNENIGDTGIIALVEALDSNTLVGELYLTNNNISDSGAIAIAKMLETNSAVSFLYLFHNHIGDKGAIALAKMLETNTDLVYVDLSGNDFGECGAAALTKAAGMRSSVFGGPLTLSMKTYSGSGAVATSQPTTDCAGLEPLGGTSGATAITAGAAAVAATVAALLM